MFLTFLSPIFCVICSAFSLKHFLAKPFSVENCLNTFIQGYSTCKFKNDLVIVLHQDLTDLFFCLSKSLFELLSSRVTTVNCTR